MKYYLLGVFASARDAVRDEPAVRRDRHDQAHRDRRRDHRRRPARRRRGDRRSCSSSSASRSRSVGRAVPHLGARHLRGRADAGHRVPVAWRRRRPASSPWCSMVFLALPAADGRVPAVHLGARRADDDASATCSRCARPTSCACSPTRSVSQGGFILMPLAVAGDRRRRRARRCKAVVVYLLDLRGHEPRCLRRRHRRQPQDPQRRDLVASAACSATRPGSAVLMTIFLASLAGIPPLGGWFAKFGAFKARARRRRPAAPTPSP